MKINVIGILIGLYLLVAALALVGVMVWAVANFPIPVLVIIAVITAAIYAAERMGRKKRMGIEKGGERDE